ncbi:NYN domain-containing protein [Auraticoccus sp. F435]|uniref:NYN domain-containing protein n=1 Tax=Auraticoccus cholistanensis TaxID=2656650 RepID=A0A6A9UZX9_9ACTN|nr:NYN domain-containing protein [Auraticoccus cholistanensis]MVA74619.1 NYN domain-containing protein [Auraticoccus cholistanensis]
MVAAEAARRTYLLIDGENIDATLGGSILRRRPQPHERPRWERLLAFVQEAWAQPVKGLFFLNVAGDLPMPFVQALTAIGFTPVPLTGSPDEKVVDIAIQRTLEEIASRDADVVLTSNDGDFLPQMEALVGTRRTAVIGFNEFRNVGFTALGERGLQFFDMEYDVKAFNERLPRLRIIPIDEFDPADFL